MKIKDQTVNVDGLVAEVRDHLEAIDDIYRKFGTELVITSARDGVHGANSLHYEGKAVDLRTWNVLAALVTQIRNALGPDFDVVLEKDHIHVEYDPNHDKVVG